jgi:hypothetical protein
MKLEAALLSEMLVLIYQTSRRLVLKEITFHIPLMFHCSDASHIVLVVVEYCRRRLTLIVVVIYGVKIPSLYILLFVISQSA